MKVVIVGGATVDPGIKDFFENSNLYVEHYNARKSSDLKKQTVPKKTAGVIITVDRSHMAFGNSNELTRYLKNNEIPFVFSSGNFATFNAAKILFQKIHKQFPELINLAEPVSLKEQKLENYKQEWEFNQSKVLSYIGEWFDILSDWEKKYKEWQKILDEWKIHLLEWKEIQKKEQYKALKKKINTELSYLIGWKEDIHEYGISIESKLKILIEWKLSIEKSCNELINTQEKLKRINKITNLDNKNMRADFRDWKIEFYLWVDYLESWQKEYMDWKSIFPDLFEKIYEWQKEIQLWYSNKMRKIPLIDN